MKPTKKWIFILIFLAIIACLIWFFSNIIIYIMVAAVISIMGQPLVKLLDNLRIGKLRIPHTLSAVITLIVVYGLIIGFFAIIIPLLIRQFNSIASLNTSMLMNYFREPLSWLNNILVNNGIITGNNSIEQLVSAKILTTLNITNISHVANSTLSFAGSLVAAVFIIGFIAFFFLKQKRMFLNGIMLFTPTQLQTEIKHIYYKIIKLLSKYFLGLCLDIFIVMTLITVLAWIFGFKNPIMIGFFAGMMNVVPYVGPFVGWGFAMMFAVTGSVEAGQNLDFLMLTYKITGILIAVNLLDAFVLQPNIYANVVKAHPLEIFLVILMAGTLAGIPGMVLAIPSYTVIRIIAKEFLHKYEFVNRITKNV